MKFEIPRKIIVFCLPIFIIFVFVIFIENYNPDLNLADGPVYDISDGFSLSFRDKTEEIISTQKKILRSVKFKETITLTRVLDDISLDSPCLSMYTAHALVDVFLDDELVYTYGRDYLDRFNSVPKKLHSIPLGSDCSHKELKIVLTSGRNNNLLSLSKIFISSRSSALSYYIGSVRYMILIGFFMFTMGLVLTALSPFLFLYHDKDLRILFSGLISFTLGTYLLAFYGVFDMLVDKSLLNTVLEYASLYNIPTFVTGYLMTVFTGRAKKAYRILLVFNIFLFLLSFILHFTHLDKFSNFTNILNLVASCEFMISVIIIARMYFINRAAFQSNLHFADNIFLLGIFSFMTLSLVDIVRFSNSSLRVTANISKTELIFFSTGSLIFVSCLLISYLFYNISSTNMASMRSKIANLAYTDQLTGLANRARCEQIMTMLSESHNSYTIISLDLNKLKQVNDTYGHHEGDRLLTGFATILSDCFWDANLIGRMGGDEFIVILMEERALRVTKRLHELYFLINEWNKKEQMFKYSTSYGYAYSYEVPNGSAKEVYMLADSRMYEMKREHQNNPEGEMHA